jgi:site-specific recombinase XerD
MCFVSGASTHLIAGDEDWIFASPHYHGKTPYAYQIPFRRHIRPVIERVSSLKSSKQAPIGWHTLRHSVPTLLISNGENVKVAQSQLRHTTPKITLELYAQAVSADQQKAHRKGRPDGAAGEILGAIESAKGCPN